ncbi:hypothetical protein CLOLEP_03772 [[Clostridium] leptum DSM 753]|uniref:Uncharacterized protein n=1 Tax=[Clostridium] leptum DSM 753 TaxID=428125 RepID=A7VYU4_9FIRM|nr:hypothetical protein CLOLEP_03772 [[Clostridium] leptum DSM 753]
MAFFSGLSAGLFDCFLKNGFPASPRKSKSGTGRLESRPLGEKTV